MAPHNTPVHRLNFTRLTPRTQNDANFRFNIVFIHGLRGHPRRTWEATTKGSTVYWPEDYVVPDIPNACVWTYGYNADVIEGIFKSYNKNSVSQHGEDLAVRLEREIDNEKPLVFVVHSLGGIITKHAIYRSDAVRKRTKLILFLGTPHKGSKYASWGQTALTLARMALQGSNKELLKALEVDGEMLQNIHENFKKIASKGEIKIYSFQESKSVPGLGGKVVDDSSSKLELPREIETVGSIDADHREMAKCYTRNDQTYRLVSSVLKAFARQEPRH